MIAGTSVVELHREALGHDLRQRDVELPRPLGRTEVTATLPVDHLEVSLLQLETPRKVAHVVLGKVFEEEDPVARHEIVFAPRALAGLHRAGSSAARHSGRDSARRSGRGVLGSAALRLARGTGRRIFLPIVR